MIYEWDENKNKINILKHKIDFYDAAKVFNDPYRIDRKDVKHSQDEERRQVIGMVENVLFVVYTLRGESTRLISARIANKKEREVYNDNKNK